MNDPTPPPPSTANKPNTHDSSSTALSAPTAAPAPARDPNDPMTYAERNLFPTGSAPPLSPSSHRPVRTIPRPTREATDERCRIWTRQTNARRALGREPKVTMWCYITMRKQIANLIPVPGQPGAFLAKDSPKPSRPKPYIPASSPTSISPQSTLTPSSSPEIPTYHWPFLDGRYLYIASGRETVMNHLNESGGPDERRVGVQEIEKRCEEKKKEREEKRSEFAVKRALGMMQEDDDNWEKIISLTDAYSHTLQRFHIHLDRIYSPGLRNLSRLPQVWTDGTSTRMIETCREKLTDGSAFKLVERMYESTIRVMGMLNERRKNQRGSSGSGEGGLPPIPPAVGGSGGIPPPILPPPTGAPPM